MAYWDLLVASILTNFFWTEATAANCIPHRNPNRPENATEEPNSRVRRPFFIIGHMVNSVKEVDKFLQEGSNALEADIEFADNGTVLGTFHGVPCDCFRGCLEREHIATFLSHIRDVTGGPNATFGGKMNILFLDLKTVKVTQSAKVRAGLSLARNLFKHLWHGVPREYAMNVLISIGYLNDKDVIKGALKFLKQKEHAYLLDKVGFDVGMNEPLKDIMNMYKKLGIKHHRWQGDGLSNCLRFLMPVNRLREAIMVRDSKDGYIDKVYHWTVDLPYYIDKSIRLGVDGIITNQPRNVLYVVTNEFRHRLKVADRNDSPWKKFCREEDEVSIDVDNEPHILGGGRDD